MHIAPNTEFLADHLLRHKNIYKWQKDSGEEMVLTYSFLASGKHGEKTDSRLTNPNSFTDEQKQMTASILQNIAKQTGLEFRLASPGEHSDLTFASYHNVTTVTKGLAWMPQNYKPGIHSTEIWVNTWVTYDGYDADGFENTLIHEIGHALGLSHISDYNQYSAKDSIMWPTTSPTAGFQAADITALQKIYGQDTRWQNPGHNHIMPGITPTQDSGITVSYHVMQSLYEKSDDAGKSAVLSVWHKLHGANYDARALNDAEKSIINVSTPETDNDIDTDTVTVHISVDSQGTVTAGNNVRVTYDAIKDLYDSTTEAAQKHSVLEFWHQLHESDYNVDVSTLSQSQKHMLDSLKQSYSTHQSDSTQSNDSSSVNVIVSRPGAEILQGSSGKDIFTYTETGASTSTSADTIHHFTRGEDKIDISALSHLSSQNAVRFSGQLSKDTGYTEVLLQYDAVNHVNYLNVDVQQGYDLVVQITGDRLDTSDFIVA